MIEILTDENFLRLMVDAEIYVDGNVTTQFHTLDKMVDTQRMIFVQKLHPEDYNLQMETLRRISIDEDAFFEHTLSEDIIRIMRRIRKNHLGDVESRADTSIVDRMAATVDEVAGFKGTPVQKFKLIFQKWFGRKEGIELSADADKQLEAALNCGLQRAYLFLQYPIYSHHDLFPHSTINSRTSTRRTLRDVAYAKTNTAAVINAAGTSNADTSKLQITRESPASRSMAESVFSENKPLSPAPMPAPTSDRSANLTAKLRRSLPDVKPIAL